MAVVFIVLGLVALVVPFTILDPLHDRFPVVMMAASGIMMLGAGAWLLSAWQRARRGVLAPVAPARTRRLTLAGAVMSGLGAVAMEVSAFFRPDSTPYTGLLLLVSAVAFFYSWLQMRRLPDAGDTAEPHNGQAPQQAGPSRPDLT